MRSTIALFTLALAGLAASPLAAAVERRGEAFVVSGAGYSAAFSAANGSILSLSQAGRTGSILRSGEWGLWQIRFREGGEVSAAAFSAGGTDHSFTCEPGADSLKMTFRGPEVVVVVTATGRADGVEFVGQVTPREKTVLDFALPARLRFAPDALDRLICPMNGNMGVGTAFKGAFFAMQPQDTPSGWRPQSSGTKGYEALYGGPLDQRPDRDPPTKLQITPAGREWFPAALAGRVEGAGAAVNRPPTRAQADLVLADSPNGPYFSASHLGGKGYIWRLGGGVHDPEKALALEMVGAVVDRLAATAPAGRTQIGLLSLRNGPENGGWANVTVSEWRERFRRSSAVRAGRARVVEIATPGEMLAALKSPEFVVVLNPYGEWAPAPAEGGMESTVAAVKEFVRAGGNWFEVGGYPFYYAMAPIRYLSYGTSYPPAFADFFHLDTRAGSASVHRAQPWHGTPWASARDKEGIFVPGRIACGGDEQGGYCDRPYATFVPAGQTWRAPAARLTVGNPAGKALVEYCAANGINRRLEEKMAPEVLAKFKNSVMLFLAGDCREKTAHLQQLPVPTQIHFSGYLKGGFDKQYPDHLPVRAAYGTPAEFRAFFDRAHRLGHLVMPYTNYSWWCDHPKGPTFEREGEAPLLKGLDGKLSYERYAANDGYTVCHWHPAVQSINREVVRQFSEDFPVDVLFQDQCGARAWHYDTNPASPTPYAYMDGLLSQVVEDSKRKPLSTEAGWDQVANWESQLCGMAFQIVPTQSGPSWRVPLKELYPPETGEVFPLAQYVAHDKTAMIYHDLGQFVTNREVLSWTLGLGFCMSYRISAGALDQDAPREWLRWLDRVQKSVCARYVGQPVTEFAHDRGPAPTMKDEGVMRAAYGPVRVAANLGPKARTEAGRDLPPFGFVANAPGVIAANVREVGSTDYGEEGVSFVTEGDTRKADVWVYAPAAADVAVELPAGLSGKVTLEFEGAAPAAAVAELGVVRFRLPARSAKARVEPPADLAGRAPREWPGARPALGIVDFGAGIAPSWTSITPAQWGDAFAGSRLAKEMGIPVKRLSTPADVAAALQAGPRAWLAIINPYGETFPAVAPGKWREALQAIRQYVESGGCWWETGGYSFHNALAQGADGLKGEPVGPSGMGLFGLSVGGGEVDQAAEPLVVPAEGQAWLSADVAARVAQSTSAVNRSLPRSHEDPGHVTLVAGEREDFIGGYRLNGWGWLWRVGGFNPNPDVVLPVAVAAVEHLYTTPPAPVKAGGVKYLWHAVVTPAR